MRAEELERRVDLAFAIEGIRPDEKTRAAVCVVVRTLVSLLDQTIGERSRIGGTVFRLLFPRTHEGLVEVRELLEDYMGRNCR